MIEVDGLDELAKELRRIDPRLSKELTKAHKEISVRVTAKAAARVGGLGVQSSAAAGGVRARAGQKYGAVALLGSNRFVRAVTMGTKVHWVFGRPVPAEGMARRVFRPWVGTGWTPEEGLYGVSPAIKAALPGVVETYADRIMEALKPAFPD